MSGITAILRRLPSRLLRRRSVRFLALFALVSAVLCCAAAWLVPLPARLVEAPSTVVELADGSPIHVFLSPDDKYRMAADLAEIDPGYVRALLAFEDKRFRRHLGVDPAAVVRSAWINLRAGRVLSGASTITMQLVRVLEPRPRTLASKVIEALRAVQLELRMSKDEVLAAYLTFISFGRNVEGLEAASYAFFGHGPRELAPEEIATLLAVPQLPARRFPSERNEPYLEAARNDIAAWLLERGALPLPAGEKVGTVLERIRSAGVPTVFRPLPRQAIHAAYWLRGLHPGETRIRTTLERGPQLLAERLLGDAHARLANLGIHNGAAVVVDRRTAEVRALVGNFDFWDAEHGGQIVGFDNPRSPGSALKPFIYGMAIDRGLALPEHLVSDVPVRYGPYAPTNYDGEFAGLVRLEDALSESLNIPFVRLLGQVGVERFAGTLRQAGVRSLATAPGYYGLSAAIGAMELTPLELAGLYTALANDGRYRPLRWLADGEASGPAAGTRGVAMLSPGAAYLTRRALARRDRPDFPERRRFSGAPVAVHWKTGTSYGHRDAWAAGSGPRYTAVVWLGNFDMSPSVDLVGADAAGPILFDLLEALADRSAPTPPDPVPGDLKRVEVCAYSGRLPTAACGERRTVLALRRRVPTERCPYHVAADVDLASGLAVNPSCRAGRRWERRSFVVWPASIRRYLTGRHRWLPQPPSLAPGCEPVGRRLGPQILSPPAGQVLVLIPGVEAADQEVPFLAEIDASGARLSWFVDGEFLGTVSDQEELWWTPEPGAHEILVMDEAGGTARRSFEVRGGSGSGP